MKLCSSFYAAGRRVARGDFSCVRLPRDGRRRSQRHELVIGAVGQDHSGPAMLQITGLVLRAGW